MVEILRVVRPKMGVFGGNRRVGQFLARSASIVAIFQQQCLFLPPFLWGRPKRRAPGREVSSKGEACSNDELRLLQNASKIEPSRVVKGRRMSRVAQKLCAGSTLFQYVLICAGIVLHPMHGKIIPPIWVAYCRSAASIKVYR